MPGVHIVTDSSCDLPSDVTEKLGIRVVPLSIRFGDDEYVDGVDLSASEFYARMAQTDVLPSTAAPAPGAFEAAFREAAADGGPVVCINLSAQLSATMQSAENAAQAVGDELEVTVIDSRSITAGLGSEVVLAAEAAADGASAADVVALVEELRTRTHIIGALDTLDNLKKGGRIGGAQALIGSMLSIKPIIDISSGKVEEAGRARTRRKALMTLRDRVFAAGDIDRLTICTGGAPEVDEMREMLAPRFSQDDVAVCTIGPVIGAHGGPRVLGLAWIDRR
ncbi:MAG: hypothetical protein JWN46_3540 [Acidimicrobiales bacterium]|nr:hypothetical protein [Acidimicrobiales bacterium]